MNNLFATAAAGFLALFGGFGGHDGNTASTSHFFDNGTTTHREEHDIRLASSTKSVLNISCITTATAAREASIDAAISTYTSAINTAYTTRASALASAYGQTGTTAIRAAVKTAWQQFIAIAQGSKRAWQKSDQSAWMTFRTAIKACGPNASAVADTANMGSEVSGQ